MVGANAEDIAGELTTGPAAAWNQHDMHAFASLFHDDAAFVNVAGTYLRGRGEIEQGHAAAAASAEMAAPPRSHLPTSLMNDVDRGLHRVLGL
jgi:ketosteroid isomerase-like protein